MLLSKFKIQVYIAIGFILLTWVLYAQNAVSLFFIFYNIFILFSLYYGLKITLKYMLYEHKVKKFRGKLFMISFFSRLIYMLILLFFWYYFTNTPFSVEAVDSLLFHKEGLRIASDFSISSLWVSKRYGVDDSFFPFILGAIYYVFGDNVFIVRLFQVFVSSLSVVFLYDTIKVIDNEVRARVASLVLCFSGVIMFYNGVHLKETWMIFFTIVILRSVVYLTQRRWIYLNSLFAAVSLFALLGMRYALFFIVLFSIIFYVIYNNRLGKKNVNIFWRVFTICLIAFSSYYLFRSTTFWKFGTSETVEIISGGEVNASGQGRAKVFTKSSLVEKFTSGIIAVPISSVTPFPSLTQTNINQKASVKQTEQWYHIGNLFLWGMLTYFFFVGVYMLYKFKLFKAYTNFLFLTFVYMLILLLSMYLTSIRFNVIKIFFMIPIVAFGMSTATSKSLKYWTLYTIAYCCLVIIWNFLKLARAGII